MHFVELATFLVRNSSWNLTKSPTSRFYRAMHFSAKRDIAIACRLCLSVRLSVCDVDELWSHGLEFFENN